MEEKVIKHRNKPSHYTRDIHIRLSEEMEELVKIRAIEEHTTTAKLLRKIIENYVRI